MHFTADVESIIASVASVLVIAAVTRIVQIYRFGKDRTRLIHDLETAVSHERLAGQQLADSNELLQAARLATDAYKAQLVELNVKIDELQTKVDELSHKLDTALVKYEIAIEHIVAPKEEIPAEIRDDVRRAMLRVDR